MHILMLVHLVRPFGDSNELLMHRECSCYYCFKSNRVLFAYEHLFHEPLFLFTLIEGECKKESDQGIF